MSWYTMETHYGLKVEYEMSSPITQIFFQSHFAFFV